MLPVCACSYIYISRHIRDVGYSCVCRVFLCMLLTIYTNLKFSMAVREKLRVAR